MTASAPSLSLSRDSTFRLGVALDRLSYLSLWGFVATIPWEGSEILGGFTLDRWFAVLAFGLLFLRLSATGRMRSLAPVHYCMLAFVGWVAAGLLWTVDPPSTTARLGTFIQLIAAVWLIWELVITERRVVGLLQAYAFGIFTSSLDTIVNYARGVTATQLEATTSQIWDEQRFSISGMNANDLGLMLAISIPMILYLASRQKNPWARLLAWTQYAACISAIMLTGSRGALLSGVVGSTMLLFVVPKLPGWQKILCGVVVTLAVITAVLMLPAETWQRLLSFGTEVSEGTLTHRTVIWAAGWQIFRDHAFLGVGSGSYGASILRMVDIPFVAHNTFLSVLVELGVIGTFIFFVLVANVALCAFSLRNLERRLWIVTLITWMVGVSALTFEYRKITWFLFAMVAAHAYSLRIATRRIAPQVVPVFTATLQPELPMLTSSVKPG